MALYSVIGVVVFTASFYLLIDRKKTISRNKGKKGSKDLKYDKVNNILKTRNKGYFSYDRIYSYLKAKGNPLKLSPGGYIITKGLCSFIVFILSLDTEIFSILFAILGFFIIDLLIYIDDKNEMKKIRIQLADVYDFLNIQTSAGVFIGSALTEAYLIVGNKRLKRSMAELCAEINLTRDISTALDKFGENFKSVEIDAFILTIKQSLRTGKIQQALDDLSNSQKEINLITIQEQTDKIKVTKDIIQVLMYIGILAIIFFGLVTEVSKGWYSIF